MRGGHQGVVGPPEVEPLEPEVVNRTGTTATVESGRGIGTEEPVLVVQPEPVIVGPVGGTSG